jgi:wyosine [tRNA(Phe)-imidazoG37] synthetase (radical SAM superfamily)
VHSRLANAKAVAEQVDYLTFVPNGEPSLDVNLGREIMLLKAALWGWGKDVLTTNY